MKVSVPLDYGKVKPGDVYRFRYHDMKGQSYTDRYWCFDGQLVAVPSNGRLILRDTYDYQFAEGDGRFFEVEAAVAEGELTFVCNLNDLEPAQEHETRYYNEADLFDLSYQHGCYPKLMKRKGAKRSREAMYKALAKDRTEAEADLRAAVQKLEWIARTRQVVEDATDLEKIYP